tara:strand:+ start:1754 stop:2032 length:279 start_codon:yes stop_codon:yes gene_type:complete
MMVCCSSTICDNCAILELIEVKLSVGEVFSSLFSIDLDKVCKNVVKDCKLEEVGGGFVGWSGEEGGDGRERRCASILVFNDATDMVCEALDE